MHAIVIFIKSKGKMWLYLAQLSGFVGVFMHLHWFISTSDHHDLILTVFAVTEKAA